MMEGITSPLLFHTNPLINTDKLEELEYYSSDERRERRERPGKCPYYDFIQSFKLSSDGNTLLTLSDQNVLSSYQLSTNVYTSCRYYLPAGSTPSPPTASPTSLKTLKSIQFGESVYDYRFFPIQPVASTHTSPEEGECDEESSPTTTSEVTNPYLLLATKDHPIQLYNLLTDQICTSYIIHNTQDELETIYTINYNATNDKLIAGADSFLYLFDLQNPYEPLSSFPTNKAMTTSKPDPLACKGMISCIESNPDYSGLFAIATFSSDIAFYDERQLPTADTTMKNLPGGHGISQLKWSRDGNNLFINCRKHRYIYCYDVRYQKKMIGQYYRNNENNYQKMMMDIDPWGDYLITGNQLSHNSSDDLPSDPILIYNTKTFDLVRGYDPYEGKDKRRNDFRATVHSVLFHPFYSTLITATGDRIFADDCDNSSCSETDSDSEDLTEMRSSDQLGKRKRKSVKIESKEEKEEEEGMDSRLSIWSLPKTQLYFEEEMKTVTLEEKSFTFDSVLPMLDDEEEDEEGEIKNE
eukprot:gene17006-19447_t